MRRGTTLRALLRDRRLHDHHGQIFSKLLRSCDFVCCRNVAPQQRRTDLFPDVGKYKGQISDRMKMERGRRPLEPLSQMQGNNGQAAEEVRDGRYYIWLSKVLN